MMDADTAVMLMFQKKPVGQSSGWHELRCAIVHGAFNSLVGRASTWAACSTSTFVFDMPNVPARQQCPCVDVAHEELL